MIFRVGCLSWCGKSVITVRDLSSGSGKNHECKLSDVSHDGSGDGGGGS